MCDIIERIESHGIDREQFLQVLKKRPGPLTGKWSEASITLIILGVIDDAWAKRVSEEAP